MSTRTAMVELYGRKSTSGFKLDTYEIKYITEQCLGNSLAYFLVLLQQAKYITDVSELDDKHFAHLLGLSIRTVQRIRLSLVKAKMISFIKKGDMTVVLLGYEAVCVHEATGCDVIKVDAIKKVKKLLNISSIEEFVEAIPTITEVYQDNPEMFD